MAEQAMRLRDITGPLSDMLDSERVLTDPDVLARYATDTSHSMRRMPDVVVQTLTTEEVQQVVRLARQYAVPVTPRSSGVGFHGAGIPEQGGIVLDMSAMNKVRRIDRRNKWVLFEAGVTYPELQAALAPEGMRMMVPLLPHPQKSALTSALEREPKLTSRHHLDETIMTMEMVLPTGELFHTGSMAISPEAPETIPDRVPCDLCNFMGPGIDWYRLVPGSLGSFGIVTVMNVKVGFVPERQQVMFIGFDSLQDSVAPVYHILRKLIGDECLLLNRRALATILAAGPADIAPLSAALPPFVLVLNLTAGEWFPEEKMDLQQQALREAARTFLLRPMETLPGVPDAAPAVARWFAGAGAGEPYWKFRARGGSRDIFFLTPLQRAPEFHRLITDTVAGMGCSPDALSLYLQPKQNGRAFHMEVSIPFDPGDVADTARADALFQALSRALVHAGAFFYRVYGPWAGMVYARTGAMHATLKRIKGILDPAGIMNPGKLGL